MLRNFKLKIKNWESPFMIILRLRLVLVSAFLVAVSLIIGFQSTAFTGFPKGYDSLGHAGLIKIIRDNFPYTFWNSYWYAGELIFPRSYPPLYHFFLAFLAKILPVGITNLMLGMAAFNIASSSIFLFGTVYLLTKRVLPGVIAALFYLSSSTLWSYLLMDGLYPRTFAQMTLVLAVFILLIYFRRVEKSENDWSRWLVVFAFSAVFLSHFLAVVLLVLTFLVLILILFPRFDDRLVLTVKIFLPVLGLVAFFYLPLFFLGMGNQSMMGSFEGGNYIPLAMIQLFRQTDPGLPFLSLPLFLFFGLLIFLVRQDVEAGAKVLAKIFWASGFLAFLCLLYVLGFFGFYFSGIYPSQFLLPAVFFLSIFFGLGFWLLLELKILNWRFVFLITIGLFALALSQISPLKQTKLDHSRTWLKPTFKTTDANYSYRFAHHNEILGGAFNYYSPTLQTGGYWGQGIISPGFWWFEDAVFGQNNNPEETAFLLDWYAVRGFYTRGLIKGGKDFSLGPKLKQDKFFNAGDFEWIDQNSTPILEGRRTPVVFIRSDEERYNQILKGLAQRDADSRVLIPLRIKGGEVAKGNNIPIITSWPQMEETLDDLARATTSANLKETVPPKAVTQKASFVHNQKWQVDLFEKAPGVLLKESYFRNWHASLKTMANGKLKTENLKIFQAGPGMMYVFLPDFRPPASVVFEYRLSLIEKISFLISFVTLCLILLSWFGLSRRVGRLGFFGFRIKMKRRL